MWGDLALAVDSVRSAAPTQTRSHYSHLAQITDAHIAQQTTGGPETLPAVFTAVKLVQGNIAQLPVTLSNGEVPLWLRSPRRYGASLDLFDQVQIAVASMALRGAAYFAATRVAESWRLEVADPRLVNPVKRPGLAVAVDYHVGGERVDVVPASPADAVQGRTYLLPVPFVVTSERPWGTGPLQELTAAFQGFADVERHANTVISGGTHLGGILESDQDLTPESALRYRESWVKNRQSGMIPVLGGGIRYRSELMDPAALQMLESRSYNAAVIYGAFGIPLSFVGQSLIGGQSSLSYSNAQDNDNLFRRNCLASFTDQLADALSTLLAPGRNAGEDQRISFDYSKWRATDAVSDGAESQPAQ